MTLSLWFRVRCARTFGHLRSVLLFLSLLCVRARVPAQKHSGHHCSRTPPDKLSSTMRIRETGSCQKRRHFFPCPPNRRCSLHHTRQIHVVHLKKCSPVNRCHGQWPISPLVYIPVGGKHPGALLLVDALDLLPRNCWCKNPSSTHRCRRNNHRCRHRRVKRRYTYEFRSCQTRHCENDSLRRTQVHNPHNKNQERTTMSCKPSGSNIGQTCVIRHTRHTRSQNNFRKQIDFRTCCK